MVFFEHHGVEEKESFQSFTSVNSSFPVHLHRAYELIIVNDGELAVTIDQQEYTLYKNDAAFIFNNQVHGFKTRKHSKITIVIFSPELIGHFFMNYKGYIPENNILPISHLPDLSALNSVYKQKSFLYEICSILVDHTRFLPVEQSTKTKVLHRILLFVDKNYMNDCTLKIVAEQLKYDYAYLSKLFVSMTNMHFTEYLNHYRISLACYQLKNSQQSVGGIAINCGYTNLRSFNRNFKKITGHSPKSYRELL